MILSFHPCIEADESDLLGDKSLSSRRIELIKEADAIILPQESRRPLYDICTRYCDKIFPNYDLRFVYPGKVGQNRLFIDYNLPHPVSRVWSSLEDVEVYFRKGMPGNSVMPFYLKADLAHEGKGVFLVRDEESFERAVSRLSLMDKGLSSGFLWQEYIPSGGNVLRVVIIGKRLFTYWKRPGFQEQRVTTISSGAKIDYLWKPELQKKGENEVRILSEKTGINLAAIDIVFSVELKDPQAFFLEINYYFGRRGFGGIERYYKLLYDSVRGWLKDSGLDPGAIRLI